MASIMGTSYILAVIALVATVIATNNFNNQAGSSKTDRNSERFNYIDVELLQEINRGEKGNIVVSPSSVKALLAMVLEGARGQSAEQLQNALRIYGEKNIYQMHLNTFLSSLKVQNPGYVVELANRMFVSNLVKPCNDYLEALQKYYYADARQVDFSSPQITATTINDWVNDKTHGLIDKLVESDSINPYAQLLLVNAIYFKGKWKVPFDTDVTAVRCFYPDDDICRKVYYMEMLGSYHYASIKELNAQALELPYEGNKFAMLLLMPNEVNGIYQLLRDIPYTPLEKIIAKLVKTDVIVSVPRFKMEYSTDLVSTLSNLGIQDIFGPKANLSGMIANGASAYISNVFHKAKIEVNEEGSSAAAATGAIAIPLMGTSFPKFHPNRPFLFFIYDLETGSTLFEGCVALPELATISNDPVSSQQQPTTGFQQQPNVRPQQVPNPTSNIPPNSPRPSIHHTVQTHASTNPRASHPPILHNSGSKVPEYSISLESNQGINSASQVYGSTRPLTSDRDTIQFN